MRPPLYLSLLAVTVIPAKLALAADELPAGQVASNQPLIAVEQATVAGGGVLYT